MTTVKHTQKTKSKILVTGGAGFIGSHTVPTLIERNYDVTVLDNLTTGKLENLKNVNQSQNFTFIQGDIRNQTQLLRATKNIKAVVHLAAQIDIAKSVENPTETHEINATGTLNLLQAAAANNVEKIIFASSTAVYGDAQKLPITEDAPLKPLSPYAASKVAGEAYCSAYANCYNLNTVSLRFFNVYGKGNENNPYSGVITKFIQKALKNEAVTIEGNGEQTRDFIHVSDTTEAICLALEHKTAKTGIFNVCTGVPTSINQLAKALQKATGRNLQSVHGAERKGVIRQSYGDPAKAADILGFKCSIDLQTGLEGLLKAPEK